MKVDIVEVLEVLCEASDGVVYSELRGCGDDEKKSYEKFNNVWNKTLAELQGIQKENAGLREALKNLVTSAGENEEQLNDVLMCGDYGESKALCDARQLLAKHK